MKKVTIAIIRQGSGFDFNRYIDRTFRTDDAALKYMQGRNAECVRIEGTWRKGDKLPLVGNGKGPRIEHFDAYYTTRYNGLLAEGN